MKNNFQNNLRLMRTVRSLTLEELSAKSQINQKTLSKYETGISEPGISNLLLIAQALNVTTDYLITANLKIPIEVIPNVLTR